MPSDRAWAQGLFNQPLLDLGEHENTAFAGVLSPRDEIGAVRQGVNSVSPFQKSGEGSRLRFGWTRRCSMILMAARVTIASATSVRSS